jgi:hypothetical protein
MVSQSSTFGDMSCCEQREADHVTMLAHPSNARSDVRHTDVPPMRFGMMGARSYLYQTTGKDGDSMCLSRQTSRVESTIRKIHVCRAILA